MLTNHQPQITNRRRGPFQLEAFHEHAPQGRGDDGSGGGSGYCLISGGGSDDGSSGASGYGSGGGDGGGRSGGSGSGHGTGGGSGYRLISGSGGGSDDGSSGASGYGSGGGDGGGRSGGSGSGHGTGGGSGYRLLTVPVSAADWGKEAWRVLLDPPAGMAATMWAHPDTASDLLDPLRKADLHMSTGFEIVDMDMFDGWYVWAALVGGCVGSVCGGLPSWRASIHGLCPT